MGAESELRADFDELAGIGRQADGGWSRPAYGTADCAAHRWFAARAEAAGLSVRMDAIGNVIARLDGQAGLPAIAIGSHLDTVPNGGAFDGSIGVLAGLEIARRIRDKGDGLSMPLEVIAFRDEEGRFGALTGSRAMMGLLPADGIGRLRAVDGTGLAEAMRDAGLDPEAALQARRDPAELAAFLELHIEQGRVLERAGKGIGIVTAIAGQERMSIRFTGEPDHAGTTPMDMRRDAFAAAARFADRFRDLIVTMGGPDARGTIGIAKVSPNLGNVVPAEVRLGLEIRDISAENLERLATAVEALAHEAAGNMNVEAAVRVNYRSAPIPMAEPVREGLAEAARASGLDALSLPSGANHDAGIVGTLVPAGMVFVPSAGGRSHCPEEHTDWTHVEAAVGVLEGAVRSLARGCSQGLPRP